MNDLEIEIAKLEESIDYKNDAITDKQSEIDGFELDESEYENQHDDMLDECYEAPFNMLPSTILEKCDPIMYAMSLSEYVDSIEIEETEAYKTLEEELETLKDELTDLEEELEELS